MLARLRQTSALRTSLCWPEKSSSRTGYFKANLYPEPFNTVTDWDAAAEAATGFAKKDEYRIWLRTTRFRVMKSWIERCRPKLVIGAGLTHLADFLEITGTEEVPPAHTFEINGHAKRVHVAKSGTAPIAVVPHLSGGIHSLNSNQAIANAAEIIQTELGVLAIGRQGLETTSQPTFAA